MGKHSQWRRLAKKARRKSLRQNLAKARLLQDEQEQRKHELDPKFIALHKSQEEAEQFQAEEEERQRAEAERQWIEREQQAQKQWIELQKRLEEAREERTRQNLKIKLEWEKEKKRLDEQREAKRREREELERSQRLLQEAVENFVVSGGDTPEHLKVQIESNPNKQVCPFFQKTSTCRFRDSCSRNHIRPGISRVLLVPNFYSHYSLEQRENEHGDSSLEYENQETYSHFKEFFMDIVPELELYGRIRNLRVCCNREPHLRGNVYVEYSTTRGALKSFQVLNGRWYGGKQLSVEFCTIDSWKSAICGLHHRGKCVKGSACNFLHVFNNPNHLFEQPLDRPESIRNNSSRFNSHRSRRSVSERKEWRWSESPERLSLDSLESRGDKTTTGKITKGSTRRSRSRSDSKSSSSRKKRRRSRSRSNGARRDHKKGERRTTRSSHSDRRSTRHS